MGSTPEREPGVRGSCAKLSEPASESCMSPAQHIGIGESSRKGKRDGEIQRSTGVNGRRSRMLNLAGISGQDSTLTRVVPPSIRSLTGMESAAYHPFCECWPQQ